MRRLMKSNPRLAGALAVAVPAIVAIAARAVLGPRGSFMLELFVSAGATALAGWLGWHFVRAAHDVRSSGGVRLGILGVALVPLLFAGWTAIQLAEYLGDLVLPFDKLDTTIVGWHLNGTRIVTAVIRTADGSSYDLPALDGLPPGLTVGPHRLIVTPLHHLVVEILPEP